MSAIDAGPVGALRVAPSILAADFAALGAAVHAVDAETDWLHLDVMDGHFVPNLSLGPPVVASLRRSSTRFFDCHLMIAEPDRYLEAFARAGADGCTVHVEVGSTASHLRDTRDLGMRAGLALNPETPFSAVAPFLGEIDLLVVMTVHPGFGGQTFIAGALEKVALARRELADAGLALDVQVDGGVDLTTVSSSVSAGANVLVAGTAIFADADPLEAARQLRVEATRAR